MKYINFVFIIAVLLGFCPSSKLFSQWIKQNSPVADRLLSIHFVSPTMGYASGEYGRMLKTTDGGTSWNILNSGTNAAFHVVHFVNDTGYLFGNGPTLLRSTNGGNNWTPLTLTIPGSTGYGYINSAAIFDGKNMIVCGEYVVDINIKAFIARSTNAGTNWQVQTHDSITAFNSIAFTDQYTGYVVGSTNSKISPILKTTDGGISWKAQQSNVYGNLYSVFFVNTTNGYVGGWNGTLLVTNNAGESWIARNYGYKTISSIFATDTSTIYGVTDAFSTGEIYRTSDNGNTWTIQFNHSQPFQAIYFLDKQTGFAVGDSGYIFKTTTGGTTSINVRSSVISEYRLDQNYPNPFNPTTTIRYSLPKSTNVKLVIYDLLGREITTLVNEEQSAGWKEVEWNAKDVSSGIYFYKIQAGSFVETKKMMILK
jgi:photosystem II stability/assembly factor-like uncharacterized protein